MKFIEMTGKTLAQVARDGEFGKIDLNQAGVDDETVVRVNQQGDIEVRRSEGWDIIGGLIGNYEQRLREATGLDWASPQSD